MPNIPNIDEIMLQSLNSWNDRRNVLVYQTQPRMQTAVCGTTQLEGVKSPRSRTRTEGIWLLIHRKPGNANNDIQPPLLGPGVLERPHAVAVDVPERPGR